MLKIAILSNSVSQKGAGISYFVNGIAKHLSKSLSIKVFSLNDNSKPLNTDYNVLLFPKAVFNGFSIGYSAGLKKHLTKNIKGFDLVHTNSIWGYSHYLGYRLSKRFKIKRICTVHGMLAPMELNRGKLKKNVFKKFFVLKSLNSADCVHVTSSLEYSIVRSYGVKTPIAIIPIGMELDFDKIDHHSLNIYDKWPHLAGKKILLYLSRIHPIKSVENLIEAWSTLYQQYPDWHLVISGSGDENYINQLQSALRLNGADKATTFTGALYNDDKKILYKFCDVFVLPTKTENFGIVVLEALMFNKPVITTIGAPWKDLTDYSCGWWIEHGVQPLKECLDKALSLPENEREQMGKNGHELVKNHYSWEYVTNMMLDLYKWQLEGGVVPGFVKFD